MNFASLEMLSTLESLADKLAGHHQNNKGIILDNNGNKLSCATIKQHPYHQNKPATNGTTKFIEK